MPDEGAKIVRENQRVNNATLFVPFEALPEAVNWKSGKTYRVSAILKQRSLSDKGANFELIYVESAEPKHRATRKYLTRGGFEE